MKEIYVTNSEVDLQMLIGLLESEGISSLVKMDGAGNYLRIHGGDHMLYKHVMVSEEDWQKALDVAKSNGFDNTKKVVKRDKTQVWTARIALIILLVVIFGSAISSVIDYIF